MPTYDSVYYAAQDSSASSSAPEIVRLIIEVVHPDSVIDVGCGTGAFLNEFQKQGVTHVMGVDGEWVSRECLRVPREQFRSHDLKTPLPSGIGTFDVALCLEVAEHLAEMYAPT
jgi:2-polyprenyl-3-methyl-5-hydroxy-6-metoxy-1,4-benzoquinol methylase